MNIENLTSLAISACICGGKEIMSVYNTEFDFELKNDNTPLTLADKKCNKKIEEILSNLKIPILSEEGKSTDFNDRKKQETQINSINMYLKEIVNDFSPYDVSVNRINNLINPSSKAN